MHGAAIFCFCSSRLEPGADAGRAAIQLPTRGQGNRSDRLCGVPQSWQHYQLGHSAEEWKTAVAMMLNVGANVPEDKVDTVLNYLVKNFPEKPAPPAVSIPGNVEVSFKEWKVPTPARAARSARRARRHHLVYGAHGQPAGAH